MILRMSAEEETEQRSNEVKTTNRKGRSLGMRGKPALSILDIYIVMEQLVTEGLKDQAGGFGE